MKIEKDHNYRIIIYFWRWWLRDVWAIKIENDGNYVNRNDDDDDDDDDEILDIIESIARNIRN